MFRSIYTVVYVIGSVLLLVNGKFFIFLLVALGGLICGNFLFGSDWTGVVPQNSNKSNDYSDQGDYYTAETASRKQINYPEEDDTYDGYYNQRAEEYQQEYGDDFEDAIDDAWEESRNNKRRR